MRPRPARQSPRGCAGGGEVGAAEVRSTQDCRRLPKRAKARAMVAPCPRKILASIDSSRVWRALSIEPDAGSRYKVTERIPRTRTILHCPMRVAESSRSHRVRGTQLGPAATQTLQSQ